MRGKFILNFILPLIFTTVFAVGAASADMGGQQNRYILFLEDDSGKRLYSKPMRDNSEFAIRFIHSVAKTPVTDHFIIKDGKIFLDKTVYHDFGAGLPHAPEGGQRMKTEHGEISITGFNKEMPDLEVRVGRIAEHTMLLFDGKDKPEEIALSSLARPGSVILFKVRPDNK